MKKFSPGWVLTASTLIIIGTILIVFLISVRQSERVHNTSQSVNYTNEVIQHLQLLVMTALDNETGARGFVISGKDEFLEPLHRSVISFEKETAILERLLNRNPPVRQLLDSMKKYISLRIQYSDSMVRTRKEKDLQASIQMVESGVGKGYSDQIRRIGLGMQELEEELLQIRKKNNESTIRNLNILLYSLLAAVLILSIAMIRRIRKDIASKEASEKRFSGLLQAAPDATVISDEKGLMRMINLQAEELFGYTREEMLDQPVEILIPKDLHGAHVHHRNSFMKKPVCGPWGPDSNYMRLKKGAFSFRWRSVFPPLKPMKG